MSALGAETVRDHADFRLMSQKALKALLDHKETNLFIRGLIPKLGFTVTLIPYKRLAREHGATEYTVRKMVRLALTGITSFSTLPLRLIGVLGAVFFLISIIMSAAIVIQRVVWPESTLQRDGHQPC